MNLMDREKLSAYGFRLPETIVERIDAFARSIEQPGQRVSRSTAIRVLLEKALTGSGFPAEAPKGKRK